MLARLLVLTVFVYGNLAFAQTISASAPENNVPSPWKNESELGAVFVSGNTNSDSTSFKQFTSYTFSHNTIVARGRYLNTQTNSTTTARAWDANGRYERTLSNHTSAYTGYGAESDIFAGYIQRDNFDLGAKHTFVKSDVQELIGEAGYRYTHSYLVPSTNKYENFGRLFGQYARKITASSEAKLWIEYLPNFSNSDAYLLNAEPSFSAAISSIFSVKMSYLMKYQGVLPAGFTDHLDTTYSTALVANW